MSKESGLSENALSENLLFFSYKHSGKPSSKKTSQECETALRSQYLGLCLVVVFVVDVFVVDVFFIVNVFLVVVFVVNVFVVVVFVVVVFVAVVFVVVAVGGGHHSLPDRSD